MSLLERTKQVEARVKSDGRLIAVEPIFKTMDKWERLPLTDQLLFQLVHSALCICKIHSVTVGKETPGSDLARPSLDPYDLTEKHGPPRHSPLVAAPPTQAIPLRRPQLQAQTSPQMLQSLVDHGRQRLDGALPAITSL